MQSIGVVLLGSMLLFSTVAFGGNTRVEEDLSKEVRISEPAAREIALARVNGIVRSEELEREHHRIVYSYDIEQPGKPGVEEVQVDAKSGKIVSVKHESAQSEEREKRKEQ